MGMVLELRRASGKEIERLRRAPDLIDQFITDEDGIGDVLDFDKAWQALHFTLTGFPFASKSPLGILLNGGDYIGEDLGYSPAWIIPYLQIVAFHDEFDKLSDGDIREKYNPQAMVAANVYLSEQLLKEGEEGWVYVSQNLPAFRCFIERCVLTGSSIVAAIT
jgi:hypothetical protein